MCATAVSTGEAFLLTGAMLGHANPRSTATYGHVQTNPSKRAANRVTKRNAAALARRPAHVRRLRKEGRRGVRPKSTVNSCECSRRSSQKVVEMP
jgi:hypothetical protein